MSFLEWTEEIERDGHAHVLQPDKIFYDKILPSFASQNNKLTIYRKVRPFYAIYFLPLSLGVIKYYRLSW